MHRKVSIGYCCFVCIYYLFKASGHPHLRRGSQPLSTHVPITPLAFKMCVGWRVACTLLWDLDSSVSFTAYSLYHKVWVQVPLIFCIARLEVTSQCPCLFVVLQHLDSCLRSLSSLRGLADCHRDFASPAVVTPSPPQPSFPAHIIHYHLST